jgi:hypothetical protein
MKMLPGMLSSGCSLPSYKNKEPAPHQIDATLQRISDSLPFYLKLYFNFWKHILRRTLASRIFSAESLSQNCVSCQGSPLFLISIFYFSLIRFFVSETVLGRGTSHHIWKKVSPTSDYYVNRAYQYLLVKLLLSVMPILIYTGTCLYFFLCSHIFRFISLFSCLKMSVINFRTFHKLCNYKFVN